MPWARIDDGWWCHPKAMQLDLAAAGLWAKALSWSCAQQSPVIPRQFPAMVGSNDEANAKQIVTSGQWHEGGHNCSDCADPGDGWIIHNWSDYQQKTVSEKRAEAGRKGGKASGKARATRNNEASKHEANAKQQPKQVSRPDPTRTQPEDQERLVAPDGDDANPPDVTDDARTLTRTLTELVKANGHPLPRKGSDGARSWLVEADRLLRLGPPGDTDGVDPPTLDEATRVARWATSDPFWRANVQSMPTFRKRWAQLRLQAERGTDDGVSEFSGTTDLSRRTA